jgi:hypothetical protein
MGDPWEVLRAAGVPVGATRPPGPLPTAAALREALGAALSASAPAAGLEALWAWLRAFRQHWPIRFERVLGAEGIAALASLSARPFDANRYLKLRRIALERLGRSS